MDRSNGQKIRKDIVEFNSIINQLDVTDIHRLLCPTTVKYTFFEVFMENSQKYTISQTIKLISMKRIEIIKSLKSDHNGIELEINNKKKKTGKSPNTCKLNNYIICGSVRKFQNKF